MFTCRECERVINQATEICPYCGADLTEIGAGEKEERPSKKGLLKILLISVASVLVLWAIVWFVLPHPTGDAGKLAEASVVQSLHDMATTLSAYAKAQGGYPQSLEQISERVRAQAQQARRQGYELLYNPGSVQPDGHIHSYSLLARPSNYSFPNLYVDETGIVRATRENRPATANDPPA